MPTRTKKEENVAHGAKGGGWGKEIGLGLLVLAQSTATVPKWGKELQPTEPPRHPPWGDGMMGHFY